LIMLACVVGIPVVALSGVSWSDMLKKLQDFRWNEFFDPVNLPITKTATTASSEAPRFVPPDTPKPLATPRAQPVPSSIVPVSFQSSADASSPSTASGVKLTSLGDLGADPYQSIQERLRRLGATYYLLESWGNQQQMYRFFCKMAVGGSSDYTRCFEATQSDPLQAMLAVLHQVEEQKTPGALEQR
jgi:hypothetical protein